MHIRLLFFKNLGVSFFLFFVSNTVIDAASHLLLKEPTVLRRCLQSFQQVRNISLKTRLFGGVDAYVPKPLQRCRFDEFRMPPVDPLTVESVYDFTRGDCNAQLLYLQISAFRRPDGSTAINEANQRILYAAADEFAAREKRVLFLDEDCIDKAPHFNPYDVVIINNLYFLRACGWDSSLKGSAHLFLQGVLLSSKKIIVASYEPLSTFRDDIMPLDKMIKERLSDGNAYLKQYLIGPKTDP